ncbi:MAG: hypothetical protein HGA75_16590 [Thiobacillus sp.]|nr:hypothetical protein [Thiobacillus sp.]
MSSIVVITHEFDRFVSIKPISRRRESPYFLFDILVQLERRGHRVTVTRGVPGKPVPGDLAVMHVDATVVPGEYVDYAKTFPYCVNAGLTDIAKRTISGAAIRPGETWSGPVIVKSNLNCGGAPEVRKNKLAGKAGRGPLYPGVEPVDEYAIYACQDDVPDDVRENRNLVVEKFIPEVEPDGYATRFWVFCGDQERCTRYVSGQRIVKGANVVRSEAVAVPDDLRRLRAEFGFDYGKIDFVEHDGKAVVLDVNKTLGSPGNLSATLKAEAARMADGLEGILLRHRT